MSGCIGWLAGTLGIQGSEKVWGNQGVLGDPRGVGNVGDVRECRCVRGVLRAGRECMYSGARRYGDIRDIGES